MNNQQIDFTDMYDLWSSESSFLEEYWWLILLGFMVGVVVLGMVMIRRFPKKAPLEEKDAIKKLYIHAFSVGYTDRVGILMDCSKRVIACKYAVDTRSLTEQELLALCIRLDMDPLIIQDFKQLALDAQMTKFAQHKESVQHDFLSIKRFIQGWIDEPEN